MTSEQTVLDKLRTHSVFRDLHASSLEHITQFASEKVLQDGEILVAEGDRGRDVFLLLEGDAQASRKASDGEDIVLNKVHAGDCLGELALIDEGPRSASIRAAGPCQVIHIRVDEITEDSVINDLKVTFAKVVVQRTRKLSDEMLAGMQERLEARTLQNQFGTVLIFTIVVLLLATSLFYLVAEDYVDDVYSIQFSWQTVIVFSVPCIAIILYLKIPLKQLGIKREGLWRSVWQALAISAALCSPALIYMLVIKEPIPADERPVQIGALFLVQYFFHSALQELGARGLIQSLFARFLDDRKGHRAIFLASMIFASLHVTIGIDAVAVSFFASLMFGYIFHYQQHLAGVTIVHYCLGTTAALLVAF